MDFHFQSETKHFFKSDTFYFLWTFIFSLSNELGHNFLRTFKHCVRDLSLFDFDRASTGYLWVSV